MSEPTNRERWLTCDSCGAGPFVEWGKPFTMHWYDYSHTRYRVGGPPENGQEGDWDTPAPWFREKQAAAESQHAFDMAEPS